MFPVTGDPASMRAAAAQLRFRAETLVGVATNVDSDVAALTYVGEAGDRFREAIATSSSNLHAVSTRMVNVADTLTRQAAVVEEQQLLQAAQLQTEQGRY
jgi:uncharacterized protein YukE